MGCGCRGGGGGGVDREAERVTPFRSKAFSILWAFSYKVYAVLFFEFVFFAVYFLRDCIIIILRIYSCHIIIIYIRYRPVIIGSIGILGDTYIYIYARRLTSLAGSPTFTVTVLCRALPLSCTVRGHVGPWADLLHPARRVPPLLRQEHHQDVHTGRGRGLGVYPRCLGRHQRRGKGTIHEATQ